LVLLLGVRTRLRVNLQRLVFALIVASRLFCLLSDSCRLGGHLGDSAIGGCVGDEGLRQLLLGEEITT